MTIGFFVVLGTAMSGLYSALYHLAQLRKLPTRAEPDYDETVASRALAYKLIIAAGVALPFLAYGAFNLADPELFRTELF